MLLLAACVGGERRAEAAQGAIVVVDRAGDTVRLTRPAERIVALLPSVNELLVAIGAGDRIVARTDYDVDATLAALPSIGGGMDPSIEALLALRPDLVITWGGPAHDALRARLTSAGIPSLRVGTQDTADVFRTIRALGTLTGREAAADSLHRAIAAEFAAVSASVAGRPRPTVLYVLSSDPPMTTGSRTYVHELIGVAGGRNVFEDLTTEFPTVGLEEIVRRDPDVLLLPTGKLGDVASLARLTRSPGWRELRAVREGRVIPISALLLDRPGPHIGEVARRIRDGLFPDAAPPRPGA